MRKRTKIVATISDKRCEVEFIRSLYNAGMNVVRINTAHVTFESAENIVRNVRKVSDDIAILVDTKGPEIRTTQMIGDKGVEVVANQIVGVRGTNMGAESSAECIYVNDPNIFNDVPVGASMLIDDGDIEIQVVEKRDNTLMCKAMNSGIIKGRKSVNIPNVAIGLPSLSQKDIEFIRWSVKHDIDFVAHSFVRSRKDVIDVQNILDEENSHIKIIAKIENHEGVENIDEILDHTYGIMVARGDLGVEIPAEQIPGIQRTLVDKCIESKKPVIIATQMLHTMINNPRPTRAEVSDIAGAIYQRVDAIMLSGETANGDYPLEAVETMARVATNIEQECEANTERNMVRINNEVTAQLARSAVRASVNLPIKAIVLDTLTGRTARYISAFRGSKPVYALCYRKNVMRELALSYGVYCEYGEPTDSHEHFVNSILFNLESTKRLSVDDLIVVIGGSFGSMMGASFIEICKVGNLHSKQMIDI